MDQDKWGPLSPGWANLLRERAEEDISALKLDPGIELYVTTLRRWGVGTCQSCQGGLGHSYPEPTVEFHGDSGALHHALWVALSHGLPVVEVRRSWNVIDMELRNPVWQMIFKPQEVDPGDPILEEIRAIAVAHNDHCGCAICSIAHREGWK